MIKRKNIIYLIICLATIIQMYLYLKKDEKAIEIISNEEIIEVRENFREIDTELNNIENLEVLELQDDGNAWSGKILLSGSKDEIMKSIELLKNYDISNYKIDGNANYFQVLLDIYR